ncbi:Pfs domain-containing protein [Mycena sanguinolenta]|uniref:Pfs domain-containing protein n=1 Tax=Mycena sanguinolenta TaxID=230812 RepID=A0A8H6XPP5_9AGAR|nr:Pfs domain-containing protein [Mycena sanguinolenta]
MSHQDNQSITFNYTISGGTGGGGGEGGVNGGGGGPGEGPTVIFGHSIKNKIPEEILQKWLEFPPDTQDRQYYLQSLHHPATGNWLLCDGTFISWKNTPGSLWIKGISGTGKSVLSSTVIRELVKTCPEKSAVAYFYFDFSNNRQHLDIMVQSIIWQLSGQSPLPYGALRQLYKTLKNGATKPQQEDLLGVLENLLSELDWTYIIIDGIDECRKTDWKHLITFIHNLCHPAKHRLHLLFTSQLIQEFETAFKDITSITLGSKVSNNDIKSFVGSTVRETGNWASENKYARDVTDQIVQKSNGMFRLAECLLRELNLCNWKDDWDKALTVLPTTLSGIYSRFLTRAIGSLNPAFIQAIFRWLI